MASYAIPRHSFQLEQAEALYCKPTPVFNLNKYNTLNAIFMLLVC